MSERGQFIVLEGQGFSGKTVQAKLLAERLQESGIGVVSTKHPGGIPTTLALREELLRRKSEDPNFSPEEEFELMSKSLHLLYKEAVQPAIAANKWVVSDRYWASVKVYQGFEAGFDLRIIEDHERQASPPHRYLLLDVPAEEIARRTTSSGRQLHSFNPTHLEKLQSRDIFYKCLAVGSPNQWRIIDGVGSIEEVHDRVWYNLSDLVR